MNQLTSLVVTSPELIMFACFDNQLTELDLSMFTKLGFLMCEKNKLLSLNVDGLTELDTCYCSRNGRIVAEGTVLSDLPEFDAAKVADITGGSFESGIVHYDDASNVIKYRYDCSRGIKGDFCMYRGAFITFKVVGGTWNGGNKNDIIVEKYFTDGKDSKATLLEDEVPAGMKPDEGYEGGAWDVTPNTEKDGITGNVTYTYTFTKKPEAPKTGDGGNMELWMVLGAVSLSGAAAVSCLNRKRKDVIA